MKASAKWRTLLIERTAMFVAALFLMTVSFVIITACFDNEAQTNSAAENQKFIVVDLPSVVGKTDAEVQNILGPVSKSSMYVFQDMSGCPCPQNNYRGESVEIVFFNGKADLITVNLPYGIKFKKESLENFGIPITEPTVATSDTLKWDNIPGWKEIAFYGNNIDHVILYVEARKSF